MGEGEAVIRLVGSLREYHYSTHRFLLIKLSFPLLFLLSGLKFCMQTIFRIFPRTYVVAILLRELNN